MAEQELIQEVELVGKIAKEGATAYFELWERLSNEHKENWRQWVRNKILPLIEKAGYVKLTDIIAWSEEPCPHSWGKYPNLGSKKGCQRCWEELPAGVGLKGERR